jgi:UDP-N-acetylmuramate: L-alanyl-gamma-D-glutamyl-meso-diaminopimelate ligase
VRTSLWGEANARNLALAVLGCRSLLPESFPAGGAIDLGGYQGLRRRQEVLADTGEIVLVEDFGHHPSAFRETLRALRERFPGRRVHAFVEPRSNTLVTRRFEAELATVLAEADAITLAPLHREERVPAGERLDREGLLGALLAAGVDAAGADTAGALTDRFRGAVEETGPPWVVVVFSNGGFHGLLPEWRARLAGRG